MVREEAKGYGISEQDLERGGYRISTTFDSDKIRAAEQSLTDVLGPRKSWPTRTQAALATIDASSGQVVSVYAGNGTRDSNAVTQDITQAGSTFKPFALVAALEGDRGPGNCDPQAPGPDSLSLRSRVDGHSPQRFEDLNAPITNFAGDPPFGFIDLVTATAQSVNTAYVNLNKKVDPEHTREVAVCAGLPAPRHGVGHTGVERRPQQRPRDEFAAPSRRRLARSPPSPPRVSVTTPTGSRASRRPTAAVVVPERKNTGKRVFDEGVMADATYAMQAVVKQGTATYVRNLGPACCRQDGHDDQQPSAPGSRASRRSTRPSSSIYKLDTHGNPVKLVPWAGAGTEVAGGTPARPGCGRPT